jgi:cell wall integrity and stress response component
MACAHPFPLRLFVLIIDNCGNETTGLYSYVQIGQGSGILSESSAQYTSVAGGGGASSSIGSIATITVSRGSTVIITSFIPTEPTITVSAAWGSSLSNSSFGSGSPTNRPDSSEPSAMTVDRSPSFWDSTSKVAGVFVAVGIVTALSAMTLFWICRNRASRQDEEKPEGVRQPIPCSSSGSQGVGKSTSRLQLLGKPEHSQQDHLIPPPLDESRRLSRSPTDLVIPVVDQRLDPQSMMIRFDDNDSRTSFRDEDDYSRRVWRVTNASDSDSLRSSET